jgi:hypothetical protein
MVYYHFHQRYVHQQQIFSLIYCLYVGILAYYSFHNYYSFAFGSSYENDSKEDVITMLKKHNFFDSFNNDTGNFANDYELKEIKGEKIDYLVCAPTYYYWSIFSYST